MTGPYPERPAAIVPAIDAPSSVTVMRSLGRRGVGSIGVSDDDRAPAYWSRYCDERVAVPSPVETVTGYRDALLGLARRDGVRTVVPVREADVFVLAKYRSAFEEHVGTPWPDLETLRSVHDRERLFAAAERAGVDRPWTRRLDQVDDWDRELIAKARYAALTADYVDGHPADRCDSPPKTVFLEPGVEPDHGRLVEAMGHVPIVQEYVRGTEYCLRAICRDGEPLATSQKRLVRGYKYPRGPSIYHEAVDLPRLEEAGLALLAELDWHGVASVGFIRDDAGAFKLLEVNPRLWASLPMDVHAGVDYPYYFWRLALGDERVPARTYRPGVASHLLRGELVHLHSVLFEDYPMVPRPSAAGTVAAILGSLVSHPRFDYLSLSDPGPFVRDLVNAARPVLAR